MNASGTEWSAFCLRQVHHYRSIHFKYMRRIVLGILAVKFQSLHNILHYGFTLLARRYPIQTLLTLVPYNEFTYTCQSLTDAFP